MGLLLVVGFYIRGLLECLMRRSETVDGRNPALPIVRNIP